MAITTSHNPTGNKIANPVLIQEYYQALLDRNPEYLGTFFVGVRTTGILCIPTCRARKPKFENVEFFPTLADALGHGYRPCKVCHPVAGAHEHPPEIQTALKLLTQSEYRKVSDQELRNAGLIPETIRRWFQKQYGMTFQTYQRLLRINHAWQELQNGQTATQAAYAAGYESISGFGYTYKKFAGKSPSQNTRLIQLRRFSTPLGPMFAAATEKGLCLLEFIDRRMLETELRDLQHKLKARITIGPNPHLDQIEMELQAYFTGQNLNFNISLDAPGSPFQQQIWKALRQVPVGTTLSYSELADKIGKPTATRAVANANGANRISIVIPCHRIIGKDGHLTGYGGGLPRKKWLLDHEQKNT